MPAFRMYLDQQGRHGRSAGDAPGELQRLVFQLVERKDLRHHTQPVRLIGIDRIAGQQKLFRLARAELPRVCEVFDTRHAQPGRDHVTELGVVGGDDQVARPDQHQAGRDGVALHLGDGDLAQITPTDGVLEVVVPLLQVERLDHAGACRAVHPETRMLGRAGRALLEGGVRPEIMTGGEVLAARGENDDPHVVVGLGLAERVVELDQQRAVLSIVFSRPVQPDPRDPALVKGLVRHQFGTGAVDGVAAGNFGLRHACTLRLTDYVSRAGGGCARGTAETEPLQYNAQQTHRCAEKA